MPCKEIRCWGIAKQIGHNIVYNFIIIYHWIGNIQAVFILNNLRGLLLFSN